MGYARGLHIYKSRIHDVNDCMAVACGAQNTLFTDSDGFLQGCGAFDNLILDSLYGRDFTSPQKYFAPVIINTNGPQPKIRMVSMHKETAVAVTDDGEVYVCGDSTVEETEDDDYEDDGPYTTIERKRGWFQVDKTYFLGEKVNMADVGMDATLFLTEGGSVITVPNQFIGNLIYHAVEKSDANDIAETNSDDIAEQNSDDIAEQNPGDIAETNPDDIAEQNPGDIAETNPDDISEPNPNDIAEPDADDIEQSNPEKIETELTGKDIISPEDFQHNNETEKIEMISAGMHHFLALSVTGSVYSWGVSNNFGQLGRGDGRDLDDMLVPVKIPPETFTPAIRETDKVVFVKAFKNSSMLVTESGLLYAFGADERGKLGCNTPCDLSSYVQINYPQCVAPVFEGARVVMVACGDSHTIAVTDRGELWGCGKRKLYTERVQDDQLTSTFEKITLGEKKKFVTVAIGDSESADEVHWMAITEKQHIFACGSNEEGKRGVSSENLAQNKLVQVPLVMTATQKAGRFRRDFEPEDMLAMAMGSHRRLGKGQDPRIPMMRRYWNKLRKLVGYEVIEPSPTTSSLLSYELPSHVLHMISKAYTNPPPRKNSIAPGIRRLMGEGWNRATSRTLQVGVPYARVCLRCLQQTA